MAVSLGTLTTQRQAAGRVAGNRRRYNAHEFSARGKRHAIATSNSLSVDVS